MSLFATLRLAVQALLLNKMRSMLTTLGVIIGVAAVIAMVSIGAGARAQVEAQFASMGSNLLVVVGGSATSGGSRGGFGSQPTLTWDDFEAIRDDVPAVRLAAPVLRHTDVVASEDENWTTSIQGTTPDFFALRSWRTSEGTLFAPTDVDGATKVVVLGQTVVAKLYPPGVDPVGQTVRLRNVPFTVIGVLERKGQSAMGTDWDDGVFVPVTTFLAKIEGGLKYLRGMILVGASSAEATDRAETQITELLRERHHLRAEAEDDFQIRSLAEMAAAQQEGVQTITTLLASIAAVSLVVGGIGIMNIMLVSVTERTREIGLRMAVGARPRDILRQFLVEALALASVGGLCGVGLGVLVAERLASSFGWPLLVDPTVVVLVVLFSAVVGVVFGLWPALKASRLDPIEALRFE